MTPLFSLLPLAKPPPAAASEQGVAESLSGLPVDITENRSCRLVTPLLISEQASRRIWRRR